MKCDWDRLTLHDLTATESHAKGGRIRLVMYKGTTLTQGLIQIVFIWENANKCKCNISKGINKKCIYQ